MSKEEITALERIFQISKETKVRLRQCAMKGRLKFGDLLAVRQGFGGPTVRDQGLQTAQAQPLIEQTPITQAFDRHQFMVALQEYRFIPLPIFRQSLDPFPRPSP